MKVNFATTKEPLKIYDIHIKGKNIAILTGYETDQIVEELFDSLLEKYQYVLENTGEGSNFLIMLIYCIINFIKQVYMGVDHI